MSGKTWKQLKKVFGENYNPPKKRTKMEEYYGWDHPNWRRMPYKYYIIVRVLNPQLVAWSRLNIVVVYSNFYCLGSQI